MYMVHEHFKIQIAAHYVTDSHNICYEITHTRIYTVFGGVLGVFFGGWGVTTHNTINTLAYKWSAEPPVKSGYQSTV